LGKRRGAGKELFESVDGNYQRKKGWGQTKKTEGENQLAEEKKKIRSTVSHLASRGTPNLL